MESRISSPYSQEPHTGLNSEPDGPVHTNRSNFQKSNLILSSHFCVGPHKGRERERKRKRRYKKKEKGKGKTHTDTTAS
jgi:hypothetical protein